MERGLVKRDIALDEGEGGGACVGCVFEDVGDAGGGDPTEGTGGAVDGFGAWIFGEVGEDEDGDVCRESDVGEVGEGGACSAA